MLSSTLTFTALFHHKPSYFQLHNQSETLLFFLRKLISSAYKTNYHEYVPNVNTRQSHKKDKDKEDAVEKDSIDICATQLRLTKDDRDESLDDLTYLSTPNPLLYTSL